MSPLSTADWGVVRLETPYGTVYVATDDDVAADLRVGLDPDGEARVVLARSEIDAVLSVACRIAPPDYLRRTLWIELRALLALKRALPGWGVATLVPHATGETVDLMPAPVVVPPLPPTRRRRVAHEQPCLL